MKLCLVASHGGHLRELDLLREAFEGHDVTLLTFKDPTTEFAESNGWQVERIPLAKARSRHLVPFTLLLNTLRATAEALSYFRRSRPDLIISTGSEIALPVSYLGRILRGSRTVYIESLSRVHSLSGTGLLLAPIADEVIVWWPELKKPGARRFVYPG